MSLCLKCQNKFPDDLEKCPNCDVYLVDGEIDFSDDSPKVLTNVADFFEANAICSLLETVGIRTFTNDSGTGGALKLYTGADNYFGKDIYVASCLYDIAKEIIEAPEVEETELEEMENETL